jgi:hypothetical protein
VDSSRVTERKLLQTSFFSLENTSVAVETIWTATFEQLFQRLGHLFVRKATKHRVQSYLRGLLSPCAGYLDYPFQNKLFGCGSLAHFSYLKRLIFSKTLVF